MVGGATLRRASELVGAGEPFVLATVVWRRGPSSGRLGRTAIIRVDGSVLGWLGGACAEPTVIRQALQALAEGTPRLLALGESDPRHDVVSVAMACESEGAMEVYLEPVMPVPRLIVVGRSPAVDALARMAGVLGWRATVVDDGGRAEAHPEVEDVRTTLDLDDVGEGTFVVVATQGHYDEQALRQALATPAAYVGLVASHKRAAALLEYLRGEGTPEEVLARVQAPAGLDLGSLEPEEMAVAILAELVARRAAGSTARVPMELPPTAVDPVCGMTVDPDTARHVAEHEGVTYLFCAASCRRRFLEDPARFLS